MKNRLRGMIAVVLSLFVGILLPAAASAEPVTTELSPVADNWVSSCPGGHAQKNGTIVSGGNNAKELRLRGWSSGPRAFRTLAQFNLIGLAGKTIQAATLKVHWYGGHWDTPSSQQTVVLYEQTDAWVEGNSNWRYADDPTEWTSIGTWNSSAPYNSGPGGSQGGGGTAGGLIDTYVLQWTGDGTEADWVNFPGEWLEFDVKDMVQAWADGDSNNGFLMKLANETGAGSTVYQMHSQECTSCTGLKPVLEVTYEGGDPTSWGAATPAEASTLEASPASGSSNVLMMVLMPAAIVVGLRRMCRRSKG